MKMTFTRTEHGFAPACDDARKLFFRVMPGDQILVEAVAPKARNMKQHRLFFALMRMVADNVDGITPEQLRKLILRRLGYCDEVKTRRGIEYFERSMAVHAMRAEEFEELFSRALDFIHQEILPVAPETLRTEVERIAA